MADKRRFSTKERKDIYTKWWETEDREYSVVPWCTGSRTWKKMEDDRASDKKLLVARSNRKYRKIYE